MKRSMSSVMVKRATQDKLECGTMFYAPYLHTLVRHRMLRIVSDINFRLPETSELLV